MAPWQLPRCCHRFFCLPGQRKQSRRVNFQRITIVAIEFFNSYREQSFPLSLRDAVSFKGVEGKSMASMAEKAKSRAVPSFAAAIDFGIHYGNAMVYHGNPPSPCHGSSARGAGSAFRLSRPRRRPSDAFSSPSPTPKSCRWQNAPERHIDRGRSKLYDSNQ